MPDLLTSPTYNSGLNSRSSSLHGRNNLHSRNSTLNIISTSLNLLKVFSFFMYTCTLNRTNSIVRVQSTLDGIYYQVLKSFDNFIKDRSSLVSKVMDIDLWSGYEGLKDIG